MLNHYNNLLESFKMFYFMNMKEYAKLPHQYLILCEVLAYVQQEIPIALKIN